VPLSVPELEQRLSSLQAQIENLRERQERSVPADVRRLSALSDEYAEHLKQWANTVERHTRAVAQLETYVEEWKDAGGRVRQDASERLNALDTAVSREWGALKAIHEEAIKLLREQAASLTGDLRAAAAELRGAAAAPRLEPSPPWPLDDVTRLHSQLRGASPAPTVDLERRLLLPEHSDHKPDTISGPGPQTGAPRAAWRFAAAVTVGVALTGGVWFVWRQNDALDSYARQLRQTTLASTAAAESAARQLATVQAASAREIASAREVANQAQRISAVLAAPDLVRYNLTGRDGIGRRTAGQALWSRSQGLVFSGTGIAAAADNQHHVLWLITRGAPVNAGTFELEADGTVTMVKAAPFVARAVVGIMVTTEGRNGDLPSGDTVLTSISPAE
jgi:hypothetical protein